MEQNSILQITQMAIMAQLFSTNSTWLHTDSDTDK